MCSSRDGFVGLFGQLRECILNIVTLSYLKIEETKKETFKTFLYLFFFQVTRNQVLCPELGLLKHYGVDLPHSHIDCKPITRKRKLINRLVNAH